MKNIFLKKTTKLSIVLCGLLFVWTSNSFGQAVIFGQCNHPDPQVKAANAAKCEATRKVVLSALSLVTGSGDANEANMLIVEMTMIKDSPWFNKFHEGMKFIDAMNYLKETLTNRAEERRKIIDRAFMEVYGKPSTPLQQVTYDADFKAKKTWYAPIVLAEQQKFISDKAAHSETINRAYNNAFGRNASEDEKNYWLVRNDHYRQLLAAQRNWLYSSNGVKDLTETAFRALQTKTGKPPTPDDVKKAMPRFTEFRMTYEEMIR